jgi:hypothetical protein
MLGLPIAKACGFPEAGRTSLALASNVMRISCFDRRGARLGFADDLKGVVSEPA